MPPSLRAAVPEKRIWSEAAAPSSMTRVPLLTRLVTTRVPGEEPGATVPELSTVPPMVPAPARVLVPSTVTSPPTSPASLATAASRRTRSPAMSPAMAYPAIIISTLLLKRKRQAFLFRNICMNAFQMR